LNFRPWTQICPSAGDHRSAALYPGEGRIENSHFNVLSKPGCPENRMRAPHEIGKPAIFSVVYMIVDEIDKRVTFKLHRD
jgi:hypothetical protein